MSQKFILLAYPGDSSFGLVTYMERPKRTLYSGYLDEEREMRIAHRKRLSAYIAHLENAAPVNPEKAVKLLLEQHPDRKVNPHIRTEHIIELKEYYVNH